MTLNTQDEVLKELVRTRVAFPPMHSAHAGFAILKEEVDELWDEVKKSPKKRDLAAMRAEAIQIAAMAIRFVEDVCPLEEKTSGRDVPPPVIGQCYPNCKVCAVLRDSKGDADGNR